MDCPVCGASIKPGYETCDACGATTKHVRLIPTGCAANRGGTAGGDRVILFLVSFLACSLFAAAMAIAVIAAKLGKTGIIPVFMVFIGGIGMFWLIVRWAKSMRRGRRIES